MAEVLLVVLPEAVQAVASDEVERRKEVILIVDYGYILILKVYLLSLIIRPVLEGGRAFIAEGTSRPLQMRDGVLIQDISTGFEVVPRVAGNEVTLEVAPQRQSPGAAGSVRTLGSATTVRARLGEWVALAGIDEALVREDRGLASRSRRGGESSRRIWVKVEEVRP